MSPDILSDMKYFVDNNISFHYNGNDTICIPIYRIFMQFVDTHLALGIKESGKTLVDGNLTRVMLTVDKGTYKVTCDLYTSQELIDYQKYCNDKLDDKEMKDDEMRYEAESDAREEEKELLNDESND